MCYNIKLLTYTQNFKSKKQQVEIKILLSVTRRELKYAIDYETSLILQNELECLLQPDTYSQSANGYYTVRSLYFDSWNNKDYKEKFAGIERRKKIRLRIYNTDQQNAKLEIKKKEGVYQKKDSLVISRTEAEQFIQGEYYRLLDMGEETAYRLYCDMVLGVYRPAAIIEYERRAYVYPAFDTRITFDRNVKSCETFFNIYSNDITFVPVFTDKVILEVKFNGVLLESIKRVLAKYNLSNVSVGKYALGRPLMARYIL